MISGPHKRQSYPVKLERCHHAHNPRLKSRVGEVGKATIHSIDRSESFVEFDNPREGFWIKDKYLLAVKTPIPSSSVHRD